MNNILQNMASVVRFHRKQSGLTQEELARLAGVGKTVVFDVENGKTTLRLTTLVALCNALNIELRMQSPLMAQWEKIRNA